LKRLAEVAVFSPGERSHPEEAQKDGEFGGGHGRDVAAEIARPSVAFLEFSEDRIAEARAAWRPSKGH